MIEFPEAIVIARQIDETLAGKRIQAGTRGNSPHKFAFYNREPEEYAAILSGRTLGAAVPHGNVIITAVEPDYVLGLGCGGERILWHTDERTLPKKYQLSLQFEDGGYLTVSIQGWGAALLLERSTMASHPVIGAARVSPLSPEFSYAYFQTLFDDLEPEDARSAKYFCISKPGIWGMGNGCLQDILFHAGIHPRRRAAQLSEDERQALYKAIVETLRQMTELGGRNSERDLFDRPGGYQRLLDSTTVGQPCPVCGTPIVKIQYLGGASYFCPHCQPES